MEENRCPNFWRLFTTKFIKSHVKLPIKSDPQKVNSIADTLSSCKFQTPFQKQHPGASFAFGPATCSLTQKANFIWWMVWLIQLKFINLCTIDDYASPNGSLLLTNEQTLLHWFFALIWLTFLWRVIFFDTVLADWLWFPWWITSNSSIFFVALSSTKAQRIPSTEWWWLIARMYYSLFHGSS